MPVDDLGDLVGRGERALELVGLPDRDRTPGGVGDEHDPDVDRPDGRRVVVEQPDRREVRHEVRHELLGPLPAQPARHVAVARVEVAADADRPPVVQPGVATGARPAHQEPSLAVSQHEVRDHLLEGRVLLGRGAIDEPPVAGDGLRARPRRRPRRIPSQPGSGTIEARGTTSTARPARPSLSRRRPGRHARPRAGPGCRPCPTRSSASIHASRTARTSRRRAAISAPFVTAIPVPISTSPRARRVMLSQPPAASVRRLAPVRARPVHAARHRLDERGRQHEGQVADRRDRAIVVVGAPSAARAPRRLRQAPRPRDIGRDVPGRDQHPRSVRNRPASDASNPRALASGHRVPADEAQAERRRRARRWPPSCSRRR